MKKILSLMFLGLIAISLTSCETGETNSNVNNLNFPEIETPSFYTNKFNEEKIPGQWSAYGVGDP